MVRNIHMKIHNQTQTERGKRTIGIRIAGAALAGAALWSVSFPALGASVWNPTLLVNTESFNTIDDGDGTTAIQMRFGDSLRETITFNRTNWRFDFSQSIFVKGNITGTGSLSIKKVMSGAALRVDNSADIWGNLSVSGATLIDGNLSASGALAVEGAAAFGSTIKLNGVTYTFPSADGSANHVLSTNGAGTLSWSNAAVLGQTHNDARYVNQAGDTMTGALAIRPSTAGEAALEVQGTASGRILSFANRLTGSGSVFIRTLTDSTGALQIFKSTGTNPVLNVDTSNERVGIGTATPETALEVVGTMSGRLLQITGTGADPLIRTVGGNIGIGTATPGYKLDVNGTAHFSSTIHAPSLGSGTDNSVIILDASNNMVTREIDGRVWLGQLVDFSATSSNYIPKMSGTSTITNSALYESGGNIGIGMTVPEAKLDVAGTISGSTINASTNMTSSGTLAVEGNAAFGGTIKLNGVTYTFPGTGGSNGQVLTTNGAGTLSWSDSSVGVGSGGVIFLSPEYPHAVYFGSGSSYIGQLSLAYDSTNQENYYRWSSSKSTLQDYWIAVRVRVPDNYSAWDANRPIQFRYRTGSGLTLANYVTMRMLDTTGTAVALTNGNALANTSWTTAMITGPESAGTYTPSGYITLLIKAASTTPADPNDSGFVDIGFINLNLETSSP